MSPFSHEHSYNEVPLISSLYVSGISFQLIQVQVAESTRISDLGYPNLENFQLLHPLLELSPISFILSKSTQEQKKKVVH